MQIHFEIRKLFQSIYPSVAYSTVNSCQHQLACQFYMTPTLLATWNIGWKCYRDLGWIDRLNLAASRTGKPGSCIAINLHEADQGSALMRAPFVGAVRRFSSPRKDVQRSAASHWPRRPFTGFRVKPDQPYAALTAIRLFTNYQLGFGCRSSITAHEIKLPHENT